MVYYFNNFSYYSTKILRYNLLNIAQTGMSQFAYFLVNVATTYHLLPLVCFLAFYLKLQTSVNINKTILSFKNVLENLFLHAIKL